MTFRKAWVLALASVLAFVIGCTSVDSGRGRQSKEALVQAYLAALQAGDASQMLALVTPGVEAGAGVAEDIKTSGGKMLRDVEVSYVDDFGGVYVVATVNARVVSDGAPFRATVPMSKVGGRYYLAVGQGPASDTEAGIASPSSIP